MQPGVGGLLLWCFLVLSLRVKCLRGFSSIQATYCCHLAHAKCWIKNSLFHCVLKSRTICFERVKGPCWSWKGKMVLSQRCWNIRKVLPRKLERLSVCEAMHLLLVRWSVGGYPQGRKRGLWLWVRRGRAPASRRKTSSTTHRRFFVSTTVYSAADPRHSV